MLKSTALLSVLMLLPTSAYANRCDTYVRQGGRVTGSELVVIYKRLLSCDRALASAEFDRFMLRATDMDTLVPLTLAAVDADQFQPVWKMLGRIPYEYHVPLAEGIGAVCADHDNVEPFIKGAYAALKGTEFVSWEPVLAACGSEGILTWMEELIVDPPTSPYNDKYNAIISNFAKMKRVEAIPALEKAATTVASRGGPFNNIVETLQRSVEAGGYRNSVSDEDRTAMEEALVRVAKSAGPDEARLVADRLYTAGNEPLAASLLPTIYPDRVQAGGRLLWAGAAIESCDDGAWIHWTSFTAEPTHWSIVERVSAPLRGTKARLKCTAEGEWPVFAPDAPLAGKQAMTDWIDSLVADWESRGLKVKAVQEKKLAIE
jgi:hypothetical protein